MNGYTTGASPYAYGASGQSGNATTADGFEKDGANDFEKGASRYDQIASPNPALADLKDPIQVHLLTETALTDSKEYQILTQEEVDKLKKQCQTWSQRVEVTRSNLAIQAKYRDAAVSMAKLHSAGKSEEEIRQDRSARDAIAERELMEKKCDVLSRELLELEKRLLAPQRKLLQHTAGILQLTHKASKRLNGQANGQINNGIPGSPESLYTYSHSRDSLGITSDENYFDDTGFPNLDLGSLPTRHGNKNTIEIPLRSPGREQAGQLRAELDGTREENAQLNKTLTDLGQKLQSLNVSLRETIIRFNPDVNNDYIDPPQVSVNASSASDMLKSQLDYLESGLVAVQAEQESFSGFGGDSAGIETSLKALWDKTQSGFAEIKQRREEYRRHRAERGLVDDDESEDDGIDVSEAYSLINFTSRVQWLYTQTCTLRDQKSVLKRQIKQQRELNNKTDAEKDEEIERRQEELEQTRLLLDRADKDAMAAQAMLSEALEDLEQARGSSAVSEATEQQLQSRNARIESLETEIEARNARIESLEAEVEARSTRTESLEAEIQARSARIESLESEIQVRSDKILAFEKKLAETSGSGEQVAQLAAQLEGAMKDKTAAEESARALQQQVEYNKVDLSGKTKELAQKEEEMEQLNMTIAELKTEVTIAKAELDGAYGTRAERAADVAALKNNAELVKLSNQVERLKKELSGTVQDLETMTKETIGTERERLDLEHKLDEAVLEKASLEADLQKSRDHITKLQDELDSERFKVVPNQGAGSRLGAGASMLSEQFRATMREERKKFQEDIREERAKCRKLEEELIRLRRSQGVPKGPLPQR